MCGLADETLEHFLLECKALDTKRKQTLQSVLTCYHALCLKLRVSELEISLLHVIVDSSILLNKYDQLTSEDIRDIQLHAGS